jgi:hypothetical protein
LINLPGFLLVCGATLGFVSALAQTGRPGMEILWSTPISGEPPNWGTGLVLDKAATFPDGRLAFLAMQLESKTAQRALLLDAARATMPITVPLALKGVPKSAALDFLGLERRVAPTPLSIAVGDSDNVWIGGMTNQQLSMASYPHADAYVAKVDQTGKPYWERTYGDGSRNGIRHLAAMPNGEAIGVGFEAWDGWVARFASDGRKLWVRRVGTDVASAVAALDDDRAVVAGIEASGPSNAPDYRQDVVAWILDKSGQIVRRTTVRRRLNTSSIAHFGTIDVARTKDGIFVASQWSDSKTAKPTEVSKLALDGSLMWTAKLPTTISDADNIGRRRICTGSLTVAANGDAVLACALGGQIHVFRINLQTGLHAETLMALPGCQAGRLAALFPFVSASGEVFLAGSRPPGNVGPGCSWMGRLHGLP